MSHWGCSTCVSEVKPNVEINKEITKLQGHSGSVCSFAFSSNGKILASGSHDNYVKLWNVETNKEITVEEELAKVKSWLV